MLKNEFKNAEDLLREAKKQKDALYDYMDDAGVLTSTQYNTYKLTLEHYQDLNNALEEFESKEW